MMARPTERGYILLASLWLIMLLALAATAMVRDAHMGASLARNVGANTEARHLADGAIDWAVFQLLTAPGQVPLEASLRAPLGRGIGHADVTIMAEAGKVDLNRAPGAMIEALLHEVGIGGGDARRLAAQLEDWRDQDTAPRPLGAEAEDYAAQNKPAPPNRPLLHWREIALLLDAPDDLAARLDGLVTVHGAPGIDRRFAPEAVRRAVPRNGNAKAVDAGDIAVYSIVARAEAGGGHALRHAVVRLMPGHEPPYQWLALN